MRVRRAHRFADKGSPLRRLKSTSMLCGAQAEFAALTNRLAHLRVAEASAALLALADAVQSDYERRKRGEAALDYDEAIRNL